MVVIKDGVRRPAATADPPLWPRVVARDRTPNEPRQRTGLPPISVTALLS